MPTHMWQYEKLTWPQIKDAATARKVCVMPVGSIEQHGPHLPMDVDCVLPQGVCQHAAKQVPNAMLLLPTFIHGYTAHVMDYPGTINLHYETFIRAITDIGRSLAYHGFKKIILVNGHGSNAPNLDLAARRINLETDAECVFCSWWSLLTVDKAFLPAWRQSVFPGGCSHACELETAAYLYLDEDNVRKDLIADGYASYNREKNDFFWSDLFGSGPAAMATWTSSYTDNGVLGQATLATKEKGRVAVEEAARQLARLVIEFRDRPISPRHDHHAAPPTMPLPWSQQPGSVPEP